MWIGCKRLILKLSEVLVVEQVKGPFIHPNQRLIPLYKWYDPRDIHLTVVLTGGTALIGIYPPGLINRGVPICDSGPRGIKSDRGLKKF